MIEILKEQRKVSVNIDEDFKILFNRVAENMGYDEDAGITDVVYRCFRRMDEKYKPDISREEDLKKIKELSDELLKNVSELKSVSEEKEKIFDVNRKLEVELKEKNDDFIKFKEKITELENSISVGTGQNLEQSDIIGKLQDENSRLESQIVEINEKIQKRVGLKENERIISFSKIQLLYLEKLIEDKKFRSFLIEANRKGTFTGLIDVLPGDNTDILVAIKSWLFYSAKLEKYPLISFDRFLKLLKKTDKDE